MLKTYSGVVWITSLLIIPIASSIVPRCRSRAHHNTLFTKELTYADWRDAWNTTCLDNLAVYCRKNITVSYFEMKPFTTSVEFSKSNLTQGILQKIIAMALGQCCGNCLNITFRKVKDRAELISIQNKESSDILFPVFTQGRAYHYNSTIPISTIPIIQMSGAMFITKSKISAKLFAKEVVMAIIDIWPLLGVAILLAFAAGVVMWIIDTWWNKEHFPRRFVTGAFEGFWWAFISMTTVGYGDRVPKSVFGRLFAVIWILMGMTICALLTAALTTVIGVVASRQRPTIDYGDVGMLKDRVFEKSILMLGNAQKVYKDTLQELVTATDDGEITGMLLDTYTAKTLKHSILIEKDLYIDSIIHDVEQSYLGVTIYDQDLHDLVQEVIQFHKENIKEFVYESFQSLDEIHDRTIIANLIFTTNSGMFTPVVVSCAIILVLSLLIGGSYELYQSQKRKNLNQRRHSFKVTVKTLKKEEEMLTKDLESLLRTWDKVLLGKINSYTLEGMFTKSNTTFSNVIVKLSTKNVSTPLKTEAEEEEDEKEEKEKPTKGKTKKPKLKRRILKKKIQPITENDSNGDDASFEYVKLNDTMDQNETTPSSASKVKKKTSSGTKKKRKNKTKKSKIDRPVDEVDGGDDYSDNDKNDSENEEINKPLENGMVKRYGAANGGAVVSRNTRRLPPLEMV